VNSIAWNLIERKLFSTVATTIIISCLLAFFGMRAEYEQEKQFLGWFLFYFIYVGIAILFYGNIISIAIEYLLRKWLNRIDWLYFLLHGIAGLIIGIFIIEIDFIYFVVATALLYSIIDRLIYVQRAKAKRIYIFLLIPTIAVVLSWGYLNILSPPTPPFTQEDAVKVLTSALPTEMGNFPGSNEKSKDAIGEYQIERETSVKKIKKEIYIITFTENWSTGLKKGTWSISYKVDRVSTAIYDEVGKKPPYYSAN